MTQLTTPYALDHTDALAANVVQQPSGAGELAFEILGDTAAGLTIGSRAELVRKGVPEDLVDALCEQLANPVTFATGGGTQLSKEKAQFLVETLGKVAMCLLDDTPLALSIGTEI